MSETEGESSDQTGWRSVFSIGTVLASLAVRSAERRTHIGTEAREVVLDLVDEVIREGTLSGWIQEIDKGFSNLVNGVLVGPVLEAIKDGKVVVGVENINVKGLKVNDYSGNVLAEGIFEVVKITKDILQQEKSFLIGLVVRRSIMSKGLLGRFVREMVKAEIRSSLVILGREMLREDLPTLLN